MNTSLSKHAARRMQQRGIPMAVFDLLLAEHDCCTPVGGGCSSIWLSRHEANGLRRRYPHQLIDLAARHALICNSEGHIVTALKVQDGKRSRRYRKQFH